MPNGIADVSRVASHFEDIACSGEINSVPLVVKINTLQMRIHLKQLENSQL